MNTIGWAGAGLLAAALALGACTRADPAEEARLARKTLQSGDPATAVIHAKSALQSDPDLAEARFVLGVGLLRTGNAGAAEIELQKALELGHYEREVIPELADTIVAKGDAARAIKLYGDRTLNEPAANAHLKTVLAEAYVARGQPAQADAALLEALNLQPGYPRALLARATRLAIDKKTDEALRQVDMLIDADARNARAWKLRGDILLYGRREAAGAVEAFAKSIEAEPTFVDGHVALVGALLSQADLARAEGAWKALKAVAPDSLSTLYFEARIAFERQAFERAREINQTLLRHMPANARALLLAGATEFRLGQYGQADLFLSRATQIEPGLTAAEHLLIANHLRSGQPERALEQLERLIRTERLPASMLMLAGEVFMRNGLFDRAQSSFSLALKAEPDDPARRTSLALSQLAAGQADRALAELNAIAAADSGSSADLALVSAHLSRGETSLALAALDRLQAKAPRDPGVASLRGQVHLRMKDTAAARKSFEHALAIDPTHFEAAARLASLDMEAGQPAQAKARFEKLLERDPKHGNALFALAQHAAKTGAPAEEVRKLLERTIEADPLEVLPRRMLVEWHLQRNDHARALTVARDAVAAVPYSLDLTDTLGQAQVRAGEPHQAMTTYVQLATQHPSAALPHLRISALHLAQGKRAESRRSLERALEAKPDQIEAQTGLILMAIEEGRFDDARNIARTVQQQRPDRAVGYSWEADVALAQQRRDLAEKVFRDGIAKTDSAELATKLHSLLYARLPEEAGRFAQDWLKQHPRDPVFRLYLGDQAVRRNDMVSAEQAYRSAVAADANNAIALNNLALVVSRRDADEAMRLSAQALRLAPNHPELLDTMAQLLADRGDLAGAIRHRRQALALQPENARVRLELARLLAKSGDRAAARSELQTLRALGDRFTKQAEVEDLMRTL